MKRYYFYKILRKTFSPIFKFIYKPQIVDAFNIPKEGKAIIASNHIHALDPILVDISTDRVVLTLAKSELHKPPLGFLFRAVGTIPVNLNNTKNKVAQQSAIDKLNEGFIINLSPEAQRNYTKELLLPFKYGAVSMAKKTNSIIVPCAIVGKYKAFNKKLKIVFGNSIDVSSLEIEEANKLLFYSICNLIVENSTEEDLKDRIISEYKGVSRERNKDTWS